MFPSARTAAITAFSVAVTEASSRKMSAPTSLFELKSKCPFTWIFAPSCFNARKCVSNRRRPITSPPGGIISQRPRRAKSGPTKTMEPRTFFVYSVGIVCDFISSHWIFQLLSPRSSTLAPIAFKISIITCVS